MLQITAHGWYHNGTLAKLKTIMKWKIRSLFKGEVIDDAIFDRIKKLPERMSSDGKKTEMMLLQDAGDGPAQYKQELEIAAEIRALAISTGGRYSTFQQPATSTEPKRRTTRFALDENDDEGDSGHDTDDQMQTPVALLEGDEVSADEDDNSD